MPQQVIAAIVAAVAMAIGMLPADAQEKPPADLASRVELQGIRTLTLSDESFLKGESDGKEVTVGAELRLAQAPGRQPAVILMHGSGGMNAGLDLWVRQLNATGIATLAIDGLTGRGLTSVSANQASLGRLNFVLDIYRALELLARHPRIDPGRIALLGFSRGGQAALYASLTRFHQVWNKSGIDFVVYVIFYPDCMTSYQGDTETVARPIRIFGGRADDYNPIAVCQDYAARLKAAGRDVQITDYPNGPHGFDIPTLPTAAVPAKGSQTVRNCRIREEPKGVLVNAKSGARFTYDDPCVERDPHVGYDPDAAQAARAAVLRIFKERLKLN